MEEKNDFSGNSSKKLKGNSAPNPQVNIGTNAQNQTNKAVVSQSTINSSRPTSIHADSMRNHNPGLPTDTMNKRSTSHDVLPTDRNFPIQNLSNKSFVRSESLGNMVLAYNPTDDSTGGGYKLPTLPSIDSGANQQFLNNLSSIPTGSGNSLNLLGLYGNGTVGPPLLGGREFSTDSSLQWTMNLGNGVDGTGGIRNGMLIPQGVSRSTSEGAYHPLISPLGNSVVLSNPSGTNPVNGFFSNPNNGTFPKNIGINLDPNNNRRTGSNSTGNGLAMNSTNMGAINPVNYAFTGNTNGLTLNTGATMGFMAEGVPNQMIWNGGAGVDGNTQDAKGKGKRQTIKEKKPPTRQKQMKPAVRQIPASETPSLGNPLPAHSNNISAYQIASLNNRNGVVYHPQNLKTGETLKAGNIRGVPMSPVVAVAQGFISKPLALNNPATIATPIIEPKGKDKAKAPPSAKKKSTPRTPKPKKGEKNTPGTANPNATSNVAATPMSALGFSQQRGRALDSMGVNDPSAGSKLKGSNQNVEGFVGMASISDKSKALSNLPPAAAALPAKPKKKANARPPRERTKSSDNLKISTDTSSGPAGSTYDVSHSDVSVTQGGRNSGALKSGFAFNAGAENNTMRENRTARDKAEKDESATSLLKRRDPVVLKLRLLENTRMLSRKGSAPFAAAALRPKTHWDYVLGEMQWMALDFRQELQWQTSAKRVIADACQDMCRKKLRCGRAPGELGLGGDDKEKLKTVATFISSQVKSFWRTANRLITDKVPPKSRKKLLEVSAGIPEQWCEGLEEYNDINICKDKISNEIENHTNNDNTEPTAIDPQVLDSTVEKILSVKPISFASLRTIEEKRSTLASVSAPDWNRARMTELLLEQLLRRSQMGLGSVLQGSDESRKTRIACSLVAKWIEKATELHSTTTTTEQQQQQDDDVLQTKMETIPGISNTNGLTTPSAKPLVLLIAPKRNLLLWLHELSHFLSRDQIHVWVPTAEAGSNEIILEDFQYRTNAIPESGLTELDACGSSKDTPPFDLETESLLSKIESAGVIVCPLEVLPGFLRGKEMQQIKENTTALLSGVMVDVRTKRKRGESEQQGRTEDWMEQLYSLNNTVSRCLYNRCLLSSESFEIDRFYLPVLSFLVPDYSLRDWAIKFPIKEEYEKSKRKIRKSSETEELNKKKEPISLDKSISEDHIYSYHRSSVRRLLLSLTCQVTSPSQLAGDGLDSPKEEIISVDLTAIQEKKYKMLTSLLHQQNLYTGENIAEFARLLVFLQRVSFHGGLITIQGVATPNSAYQNRILGNPRANGFDPFERLSEDMQVDFDRRHWNGTENVNIRRDSENSSELHRRLTAVSSNRHNSVGDPWDGRAEDMGGDSADSISSVPEVKQPRRVKGKVQGKKIEEGANDQKWISLQDLHVGILSTTLKTTVNRPFLSPDLFLTGSNKLSALKQQLLRFAGRRVVVIMNTSEELKITDNFLRVVKIPHLACNPGAVESLKISTSQGMDRDAMEAYETNRDEGKWLEVQSTVALFNNSENHKILLTTHSLFDFPSIIPADVDAAIYLSSNWVAPVHCDVSGLLGRIGETGKIPCSTVRIVGKRTLEEKMVYRHCFLSGLQGLDLGELFDSAHDSAAINYRLLPLFPKPSDGTSTAKKLLSGAPSLELLWQSIEGGRTLNTNKTSKYVCTCVLKDMPCVCQKSGIVNSEMKRLEVDPKLRPLPTAKASASIITQHDTKPQVKHGLGKGMLLMGPQGNTQFFRQNSPESTDPAVSEEILQSSRLGILSALNALESSATAVADDPTEFFHAQQWWDSFTRFVRVIESDLERDSSLAYRIEWEEREKLLTTGGKRVEDPCVSSEIAVRRYHSEECDPRSSNADLISEPVITFYPEEISTDALEEEQSISPNCLDGENSPMSTGSTRNKRLSESTPGLNESEGEEGSDLRSSRRQLIETVEGILFSSCLETGRRKWRDLANHKDLINRKKGFRFHPGKNLFRRTIRFVGETWEENIITQCLESSRGFFYNDRASCFSSIEASRLRLSGMGCTLYERRFFSTLIPTFPTVSTSPVTVKEAPLDPSTTNTDPSSNVNSLSAAPLPEVPSANGAKKVPNSFPSCIQRYREAVVALKREGLVSDVGLYLNPLHTAAVGALTGVPSYQEATRDAVRKNTILIKYPEVAPGRTSRPKKGRTSGGGGSSIVRNNSCNSLGSCIPTAAQFEANQLTTQGQGQTVQGNGRAQKAVLGKRQQVKAERTSSFNSIHTVASMQSIDSMLQQPQPFSDSGMFYPEGPTNGTNSYNGSNHQNEPVPPITATVWDSNDDDTVLCVQATLTDPDFTFTAHWVNQSKPPGSAVVTAAQVKHRFQELSDSGVWPERLEDAAVQLAVERLKVSLFQPASLNSESLSGNMEIGDENGLPLDMESGDIQDDEFPNLMGDDDDFMMDFDMLE